MVFMPDGLLSKSLERTLFSAAVLQSERGKRLEAEGKMSKFKWKYGIMEFWNIGIMKQRNLAMIE